MYMLYIYIYMYSMGMPQTMRNELRGHGSTDSATFNHLCLARPPKGCSAAEAHGLGLIALQAPANTDCEGKWG